MKCVTVKFLGTKVPFILRVLDCIVTILCGLCVFCAVVVLTCFVMCAFVYVWIF